MLAVGASESPANKPNPGLTDAQRALHYGQSWSTSDARYTSWLEHLNVRQLAVGELPRKSMFGTAVSAQAQTLDQWVASADNIIVGTATAIKPNPFSAYFGHLRSD